MDSSPDLTVQVLIQIRDELRDFKEQTKAQLAEVNARIDDSNRKIDRTNRQLVNVESRLGTELGALRDAVSELRDAVIEPDRGDLAERVTRCERDIAELRQRS